MKNIKIKSYCKINLFLRVIKKLKNGYHNITSLITFCNLHDLISISETKNLKDKVSFSGKFKKGIDKRSNTVTKILNLLRESKLFEFADQIRDELLSQGVLLEDSVDGTDWKYLS